MISNPETALEDQVPRKKRRHWVRWVALLAFIIAIASWFQLVHQQKRSTHNYSQLQSSFNQTQSDTQSLNQNIQNLNNQITTQNEQLQALQANFDRMQAANAAQELDIALEQVDRYLQQANVSLTFNHDLPAAVSLLKAADQRLSTVPNTEVTGLRQAINHDIIQLQAIPVIDYVGILSKLSALRDQVANLPLFAINTKTSEFGNVVTTNAPGQATLMRNALNKTLSTLKSLVIIRNRHQEISPLVSPTQEQFLRLNLQLILQQAQWAVLQHQAGVYQFSLTQANEWLQRYFAANDKATAALTADIKALQAINLEPKTPDLGALIDQEHQIKSNPNKVRPMMNPIPPAPINMAAKNNAPVVSIVPPIATPHPQAEPSTSEEETDANTLPNDELATPAKMKPVTQGEDLV